MTRLAGKSAIVTGGARGLGAEIVRTFIEAGAKVAVADISETELREMAAGFPDAKDVLFVAPVDICDRRAVASFVESASERQGPTDILVNNASYAKYQKIDELTEGALDQMLGVGVKAVLWMVQAVVPMMMARRSGSIINMSSIAGLTGMAYSPGYASVKGAVDAMTRALAVDLGGSGIRVNAISPSAIPTAMSRSILDETGWEGRRKRTPLGRIGTAADIAAAALYLASDESSFVTGMNLRVDGGYCIGGAIPGVDVVAR